MSFYLNKILNKFFEYFQKCCTYVYDDISDISRYSQFKKELDQPYFVTKQSLNTDTLIGNSTPGHFPRKKRQIFETLMTANKNLFLSGFTENDPDFADYLTNFINPVVIPIQQYQIVNLIYVGPSKPQFYGNYIQRQLPANPHYIPKVMLQKEAPLEEESSAAISCDSGGNESIYSNDSKKEFLREMARKKQMEIFMREKFF